MNSLGKIEYCFNKANIKGDSAVGGIVGLVHEDYSEINCSYNTGNVEGKGTDISNFGSTGGITAVLVSLRKN